ncbi:ABC transporter ATP-binding protein [Halobacillus sp. ACCC02827]|uniref:ABC transporter ATP-binding protein n=1 Tax=Halobacillus sp. ACCC02827 TaxID=3052090 RepID=UPI00257058DF|nr:ABC transporter ATP-binding protein [Halobacillus sp. ACCC02827]WJE16316.1 ABC transporter ATP-binding protein [Halobacillus sp. ACCC02827]
MKILNVRGLHKWYGDNHVLKDMDFEAESGEIIGVIGKNGAGKSTFLEILMTMKNYDDGDVFVMQENLRDLSMHDLERIRRDISVVLQPTHFYKTLKVEELLKLFQAYYQSSVDLDQIIIDFHLQDHRKTLFDKLSGGWKQKVSLAVAFLSEPKLLILDEPTTGLDPHMRNVLWSYIVSYNKRNEGTVILTTHDMDEVEKYCEKVLFLEGGKVEMFDTTANILSEGFPSINDYYLTNISI